MIFRQVVGSRVDNEAQKRLADANETYSTYRFLNLFISLHQIGDPVCFRLMKNRRQH